MISSRQTIAGHQKKWTLLEKLGEGDAGEVYLVETLLESEPAILKRPQGSTLPTDVMRQASQIRVEGRILSALGGISYPGAGTCLSTPALLDQSPPEAGLGEGFFIVIERAAGFDLHSLLRLTRTGMVDEVQSPPSAEYEYFVHTLAEFGEIPEPIQVRSLLNVINLLETIHFSEVLNDGVRQYGVIWNDVKPEHLYWDPLRVCLTVIDWGNGSFLESDSVSKDRKHSIIDDYHQFISGLGGFLAEANPELYARLEWPQEITPGSAYTDGVKPLKERLAPIHEEIMNQSQGLRNAESMIYEASRPTLDQIAQCDELHRSIVALGEIPDFASAVNVHARVALQMAATNSLDKLQQICVRTANLATASPEKWDLLAEITGIALQQAGDEGKPPGEAFSSALAAGVADEWPTLLWEIFDFIGTEPLPEWWETISQGVRRVHLNLAEDSNPPDVVVRRLFYTLQSAIVQMDDHKRGTTPDGEIAPVDIPLAGGDLLKNFEEEVIKKWREIEPAPPNSSIGYRGIEGMLEEIEALLPGTKESLENVLAQPNAHSEIVLNAWERKDFETARLGLRRLLLWDPNRRRLLRADSAIAAASVWLSQVRRGAKGDEPFYEYLTSIELAGRNLRNQVGPANWLDSILDALKRLRKGTKPADLIMEHPGISDYIPWLNEFRSREILSLPRSAELKLEREPAPAIQIKTVSGEVTGQLGADLDMLLGDPLDTWTPEARGSSARVFEGYMHSQGVAQTPYAIKVMRPERVEYALPLFKEETQILSLLRDVPGVTPMVECGFIQLEEGMTIPGDESQRSARHLRGNIVRYSVEGAQNFLVSMEGRLAQGWLPYLALVKRDQAQNLLVYCDAGNTRGWFLPLREGLLLGIQICDILQVAHDRNITYRDHKILHYYWDPDSQGVEAIDWNIAKRHSDGLTDAERQFDLSQFGARALHHILTGRPAPGALPLGPNQPEEIEHASLSYAVNWTYDDERLPIRVKEILEQVLNQGYTQVRDLRTDLVQVYQQVPDLESDAEDLTP